MYAREKDTCREPNEEDHVHNKESTNFSKNHLAIIKERTWSNALGPVSTIRTALYYIVLHSIFLAPYLNNTLLWRTEWRMLLDKRDKYPLPFVSWYCRCPYVWTLWSNKVGLPSSRQDSALERPEIHSDQSSTIQLRPREARPAEN